jgi:hypothetical protein
MVRGNKRRWLSIVGDGEVSALVLVGDPIAPSTVQAI